MSGIAWLLELLLLGLLGGVLFQALRLERALGVLKRDRGSLEQLVAGFNASTRQAEAGIERLRGAADGAGRVLSKQTETALALKDDLAFLGDRAERLADRLDSAVRRARIAVGESKPAAGPAAASGLTPVTTADRMEGAVRRARAEKAAGDVATPASRRPAKAAAS